MLLIIFALFGRAAGHRSRSQALDGQFRVGGPLGARFDRISISFFEDRKSPLATKPGPARLSGLARQNDPVKDQPASELPRRAFAPNVPESFPESAWPFSTRIPTGVRTDSGGERNFHSV